MMKAVKSTGSQPICAACFLKLKSGEPSSLLQTIIMQRMMAVMPNIPKVEKMVYRMPSW